MMKNELLHIGYTLFHGSQLMADSMSLAWIKADAMSFHDSKYAKDVFILPHPA
jgi:hypothetical protein